MSVVPEYASSDAPILRTEALVKRYNGVAALKGLTFEVPRGSIYGFVGPNGAGKTTTMRILATLLTLDGGEAWIDGKPLSSNPRDVRARIGYMPDFFGVYENLTSVEYLDFYASAYGVPGPESRRTNAELLELVDLTNKRDEFVENLSRGMKQRLGLARCLVHNPQILLLDEPASGMDPRARFELREIIKELQRMGKAILISSHILLELAEMCTHIGIIQDGRLLRQGPVDAILGSLKGARSLRVGILGDPQSAATVISQQPHVTGVVVADNGLEITYGGDEQDVAILLRALVESDVQVIHFSEASSSLEEIFMQLTESEES